MRFGPGTESGNRYWPFSNSVLYKIGYKFHAVKVKFTMYEKDYGTGNGKKKLQILS